MVDLAVFYPIGHTAHVERGHPERPERVETARAALQALGAWDPAWKLDPLPLAADWIGRLHDPLYLETLQEFSQAGRWLDGDTYTTPASWGLALNAAGGAAAVAQAVWQGQARRGFALCRPPGHHATRRRGMGFCLLNNVALAAEYLLCGDPAARSVEQGAPPAQRLAVVDLDLHHGNGTQGIFWERPEVAFLSLHQSPLYPGSGALDERGAGPGLGYTANLPLPPGSGDQAYRAGLDGWVLPLLERFDPQMLLVSFGFDPHWRDPLGSLQLSAAVYGELIAGLAAWADAHCGGRMALFLEGGYDLQAGWACTQSAAAALLGQPWQDALGPSPVGETDAWQPILRSAQRIWDV
ncbi:MAG: histone deacetylase [Chloroflexota bacterium]